MTEIRKAFARDFESVYPLLEAFHNPDLDRDAWRKMFEYRWNSPAEQVGYLLADGSQVVGFLGTICSLRPVGDKLEPFCNLSSWRVQPQYRAESLLMLVEALRDPTFTYTNFTGNKVAALMRRFGFRDLHSQYSIILPYPDPKGWSHTCRVSFAPGEIATSLSGTALKIYQDHAGMRCQHLVMMTPEGPCHLVYRKAWKKRLPVAQVQYISDPHIFRQHVYHVNLRICAHSGVVGLMVVGNLLPEPPRLVLRVAQRQAFLYKSNHLRPDQVDYLYSELQLLGVS